MKLENCIEYEAIRSKNLTRNYFNGSFFFLWAVKTVKNIHAFPFLPHFSKPKKRKPAGFLFLIEMYWEINHT